MNIMVVRYGRINAGVSRKVDVLKRHAECGLKCRLNERADRSVLDVLDKWR